MTQRYCLDCNKSTSYKATRCNPCNQKFQAIPARERFLTRINRDENECWLWTGRLHKLGYSVIWVNGKDMAGHRYSYELHKGPIPEGLSLDHLCRIRHCVNPDHLEAVTHKENVYRGFSPAAINARKKLCKNGHPLVKDKYKPNSRTCIICFKAYQRKQQMIYYWKRKESHAING